MFRHSSTIRSGLHGHLRESHEEHTLHHHNAHFIIAAEFDNKLGPVIKHQYPKSIPGFKNVSSQSSTMNLASLMIPNSIESTPGRGDFTVFILHKHKIKQMYDVFPASTSEKRNVEDCSSTILEEEEGLNSPKENQEENHHNSNSKELPLFFINVVNTLRDKTNKRGAIIRSIALGTTMKKFSIFKPLLAMTLDLYMRSNNDIQILIELFNMINSLDLSLVNRIHTNTTLQNVLNSINNETLITKIFDIKGDCLKKILNLNELPMSDNFGNKIKFKQQHIEYQFTSFTPKVLPPSFSKIPLQIDMVNYNSVSVDINYNDHVLKFLTKFIPQLGKNALSNTSWRLFINSTKETKDTLCQFVIALSVFLKGFDFQYFDNAHLIIFPYMDISFIDEFRINFSSNRNGLFFSVTGVSNPIFEYQQDVWDFYYDMDKDVLHTQTEDKLKTTNEVEQAKTNSFKKMFHKNNSSASVVSSSPSRTGLMLKLVTFLIEEQHNNETILNVFKRINILQLLNLLNVMNQKRSNTTELILKDEYVISYMDFIIFPEFFEYGSLNVMTSLYELETSLNILFFSTRRDKPSYPETLLLLQKVYSNLKVLFEYSTINITNMGKFLNICLNYPITQLLSSENLLFSDFTQVDLRKKFRNLRDSQSIEGLNFGSSKVIDYFVTERSLRLLFLPLLLNPNLEYDSSAVMDIKCRSMPKSNHIKQDKKMSVSYLQSLSNVSFGSSTSEDAVDKATSCESTSMDSSLRDDVATLSSRKGSLVVKIKKTAAKLIHRIEKHHVGKLLLEDKLNPMFQIAYNSVKDELFSHDARKQLSTAINSNNESKSNTFESVSPKRKELLNGLNLISERQESIKHQISDKKSTKPSILSALNQITIQQKSTD